MKVCMLLPTNEPSTIQKILMTPESLETLSKLKEILVMSLNFQKPYTEEEISQVLETFEKYGIETVHSFNEYKIERKGCVPFNKIRNDCYLQYPDADFYYLLDDDMKFYDGAEFEIISAVDYMVTHPTCGFVQFKNWVCTAGMNTGIISPDRVTGQVITDNGILIRPLPKSIGSIYPNDAIDLVGCGEENIIAAFRMFNGYFPAQIKSTKISHYKNLQDNDIICGFDAYNWHHDDVIFSEKGNWTYLETHYGCNIKKSHTNTVYLVNPTNPNIKKMQMRKMLFQDIVSFESLSS